MGKRSGLGYFYLRRLDSLMAIGESRHHAKQRLRETSEEHRGNVSSGKIHSHTTRRVYQQQLMAFLDWVKETYHVNDPALVDTHADEWASQYLRVLMEQGKSPSTLCTIRSALRLVFERNLASSVVLPRRTRSTITRSRVPVKMDDHFQPEHWPGVVHVAHATGLRRSELRDLRVRDITLLPDGTISMHVRNGKGGKAREVLALAGSESGILALLDGREPDERLFDHLPKNMDIQSFRRASAQARYQQLASEDVLPAVGDERSAADYDPSAVEAVSEALGHSPQRRSTVLNHYLLP